MIDTRKNNILTAYSRDIKKLTGAVVSGKLRSFNELNQQHVTKRCLLFHRRSLYLLYSGI